MRDVAREQELALRSEREPQLAASRRDVVAAERVVGMVEVADEPFPNPAQDGRAAAQAALHERAAHSRLGAKRLQVSEPDALRGGERLARRLRDHVQRAADRVAAVERPLRPAQHLDPLEVQEVAEHHRRPREVHAVQVNGRARVGAGEDDVRPDAADRELGEAGVLGERDAGRKPGRVLHARGRGPRQLGSRQHADRARGRLRVALAQLVRGDDEPVDRHHRQPQRHRERATLHHLERLRGGSEARERRLEAVLTVPQPLEGKRAVAAGAEPSAPLDLAGRASRPRAGHPCRLPPNRRSDRPAGRTWSWPRPARARTTSDTFPVGRSPIAGSLPRRGPRHTPAWPGIRPISGCRPRSTATRSRRSCSRRRSGRRRRRRSRA